MCKRSLSSKIVSVIGYFPCAFLVIAFQCKSAQANQVLL